MRHQRKNAKLGVTVSHRKAMMAHIVEGLIQHGRIRTTITRAKEARQLAERLISIAKANTLHARRQVIGALRSESAAKRLFENVSPIFSQIKGGYTRIIRDGNRPGDGAPMVYLEFSKLVELGEPKLKVKKAEKKGKEKKKWEEMPLVKKETLEEEKKEKKSKKEVKQEAEQDKPEEEKKKGGFLTSLRKFLTGSKEK